MTTKYVLLLSSGKLRREVAVGEEPLVLGRGPTATIRLPDDYCSREHAKFVERDGDLYVEDAGSRNGIFVNGERVLLEFGSGIAEEGKLDAALAVLDLNAQWYPESFSNEYGMGGVRELRGEKDEALAHYRRALELGQGRQKSFAQKKIDGLSGE